MSGPTDGPGGVVDLDAEQIRMLRVLDVLTGRAMAILDRQAVPADQLATLCTGVAALTRTRVHVLAMRRRAGS